jgi:hypothetical protein
MGESLLTLLPLQQTHYGNFQNSFDCYFLAPSFA